MKRTNAVAVNIHAVWPVSDAKLGALNSASAIIDGSRAPFTKFNTMKTPDEKLCGAVCHNVGRVATRLSEKPSGLSGFLSNHIGFILASEKR
jgi:hypothetical protein